MSICLEHLHKRYGDQPVVNHVSLEVADGEFFVLLGPSGSGKSTILRMIAGLTDVDQGRIMLHGRDVTALAPQQRGVGFVFQHYALFRHMSVAENIEFGLFIRKAPTAERRRKRDELLSLVGLAGLGTRMPGQLSGGQQQRVALARALAYEPEVLLLDEPFGALDAKIRVDLRRTLREIQRKLGTTTIFVTHDQEEAYELADRMGVMNAGRLLEVGSPVELYARPQTEFVATFLGTANLLVGRCVANTIRLGETIFPLMTTPHESGPDQFVQVLFRPEDVALAPTREALDSPPLGCAEVEQITFAGSFERLRLRLAPVADVRPIAPPVPFGDRSLCVEALRSQDLARQFPLRPGDSAWVGVRRIHALTHPGLSLLLLTDDSPAAAAAITDSAQIARIADARLTLLMYGRESEPHGRALDGVRDRIGGGLPALETRATTADLPTAARQELERQPHDMILVLATKQQRIELAEELIRAGASHLLLGAPGFTVPTNVLICVAVGEPGKVDVQFAGRLLRHFGAQVTLLTVIASDHEAQAQRSQAEHFLRAGVDSLAALGVAGHAMVRAGGVHAEILAECAAGRYDMLVLGAPLTQPHDRSALSGIARQLVGDLANSPVLIVRSPYAAPRAAYTASGDRAARATEVRP